MVDHKGLPAVWVHFTQISVSLWGISSHTPIMSAKQKQKKKSLGSNLAVVLTAAACALNVGSACQASMMETSF